MLYAIIFMVIKMAKFNSFFKIDMLVLSILKQRDCYGYEIVKLIQKISNNALCIKEGTLYPIVHTLLKQEYISSRDVIYNKKIRVYYHIEQSGIDYLEKTVQEFKINIQGVFNIINYREEDDIEQ